MRLHILQISAVALVTMSLVACSKNSNEAGQDSTAAAIADSQPGVNAPSDTARVRSDSSMRRDTLSNVSLPSDGPNRGRKPPTP